MKISRIKISEHYDLNTEAYFDIIQPTDMLDRGALRALPALLICPGGAYGMLSKREGEPVALEFLARGYVAVILNYSVVTNEGNNSYPKQLHELMAAFDYLSANCEEFGIDPDRIFVMGFSAGGHLVCNLGVEYPDYLSRYNLKIKGICLAYPVISSDFGISGNTYNNLLKDYEGEKKEHLLKSLSFTNSNLEKFPPTFIWTTNTDNVVSSLNSIVFVEMLSRFNRTCEFHLFPIGPHGFSTASELINEPNPQLKHVSEWIDMCDKFFKSL